MKSNVKIIGLAAVVSAATCLNFGITSSALVMGDVNNDGKFTIADAVAFQNYLLGTGEILNSADSADFCRDNILDVYDFCIMKKHLTNQAETNIVRVTNTDELKEALANAKAGDEIVMAAGEYVYSGATPKGRMFTGEADGSESSPIILRSEDQNNPSVIMGNNVSENYALSITGDYWEIHNIKVTNASKGIMIDNSNHTKIVNCEVYNIGAEGIHLRDNSSYCLIDSCNIHNTGIVSPGYGEGVYVGSSKSTSGYGYECDYNTIRNCTFGPDIAAEHIDVKEYTTGTIIEHCTFNGTGMSGENYADSFVDIKGNNCILRYCTGYRNDCEKINKAFEMNMLVEGWGQNAYIYCNKAYMDTSLNALGKKMVILNSWDCSETVWDNFMAYDDGVLFSCDNAENRWDYYNCSDLTYGNPSMEDNLR